MDKVIRSDWTRLQTKDEPAMTDMRLLWGGPPERWSLGDADLHIWAATLDQTPERIAALELILSSDERDRAARFHVERDRTRFIVGRGTLRAIVGSYAGIDPAQLHFAYGEKGKPKVTGLASRQAVQFNLAHSNGLMLVAVTRVGAVGIDVEWIARSVDLERIAYQFFESREYEVLMALPEDLRSLAFYNLWTRKEAYLKATGAGLGDLNKVAVSFLPDEPARIVSVEDDSQARERWTIIDLAPASLCKAAVVVAAKCVKCNCWQWPY